MCTRYRSGAQLALRRRCTATATATSTAITAVIPAIIPTRRATSAITPMCSLKKMYRAPTRAYPQRGSEGIEHEEPLPLHSQRTRHDAVELAQHVDKAREGDGRRAVSREHAFDGVEARLGQSDPRSIASDGGAAELSADPISNIVAQHGSGPCENQKGRQRDVAATGKDSREDKQRFARHRCAERLQRQDDRHGDNAVVANEMLQAADELCHFFHADLPLST
jgi:hypothetical protein